MSEVDIIERKNEIIEELKKLDKDAEWTCANIEYAIIYTLKNQLNHKQKNKNKGAKQ